MSSNESTGSKSKQKIIQEIKENYNQVEKSLVKQLFMQNSLHPTTTGSAREDIWKQLFKMIIPKKFVIEQSVFIIDSNKKDDNSQEGLSREVDLAIIDEMYTPYIFRYGRIKFVPIEAVAVVVECKSGNTNTVDWCNRINNLKTSDKSIARLAGSISIDCKGLKTQKSTRPIKILCSLNYASNKQLYDICLIANEIEENIKVIFNDDFKQLSDIYSSLNFHKKSSEIYDADELGSRKVCNYKVTNSPLLSFNFQLNQILMLINNPLLFPHQAYVDLFNGKEPGTEN